MDGCFEREEIQTTIALYYYYSCVWFLSQVERTSASKHWENTCNILLIFHCLFYYVWHVLTRRELRLFHQVKSRRRRRRNILGRNEMALFMYAPSLRDAFKRPTLFHKWHCNWENESATKRRAHLHYTARDKKLSLGAFAAKMFFLSYAKQLEWYREKIKVERLSAFICVWIGWMMPFSRENISQTAAAGVTVKEVAHCSGRLNFGSTKRSEVN